MDTTERMQDHEILLELLREKHRRESREKIILIIVFIIAAAIIAGLIFVIPRIMRAYESYKQAMQYIDDIYKQAGPILKSATETFEDKIYRLICSEAMEIGHACGIMAVPQTSRQSERSAS